MWYNGRVGVALLVRGMMSKLFRVWSSGVLDDELVGEYSRLRVGEKFPVSDRDKRCRFSGLAGLFHRKTSWDDALDLIISLSLTVMYLFRQPTLAVDKWPDQHNRNRS